jgi:DNA-binding response OmpR family regulator
MNPSPRTIVLVDADTPTELEVRQLALGADCVLRYPIRSEVLAAYVAKYYTTKAERRVAPAEINDSRVTFCGAVLTPLDRTLQLAGARVSLTPREATLIEVLVDSRGSLVSYERLYSEVLGRKFRGETSNMRVLLGKLGSSCRGIGIHLRLYVKVVPKGGYQYDGFPANPTKTDQGS